MIKLAGLPMYDFPEIRRETDEFWSLVRYALLDRGVRDIPTLLTRPSDLPAFWRDPSLLLGQTCGYPLMTGLCGQARYVATPCYRTRFSHGSQHKSIIIVQQESPIQSLEDARGKICAINMSDSNTGMNLLRLEVSKLEPHGPFFGRVFETLAHRKSMVAVAKGDADLAAIDCVTFSMIEKIDPSLTAECRIIAETEDTPALPFITSAETDEVTLAALRIALSEVVADQRHAALMKTLMIEDINVLPAGAYDRIHAIEHEAISRGYPELR